MKEATGRQESEMRALITGASSGIGRDMALYLSKLGWKLIITGRNEASLRNLRQRLGSSCEYIVLDLTESGAPQLLYDKCKGRRIDMLVNNAGFGLFGKFTETSLEAEHDMIALNIVAVHDLTKLFLRDFVRRDSGLILNVASSAGFLPGPLMSTYYSSKAYVLRLSEAVYAELKDMGSRVKISVLCPGPVSTEFNKRAGVMFSAKPLTSSYVAKYAIDNAFRGRLHIIPSFKMKLALSLAKVAPLSAIIPVVFALQKRKLN